MTGYCEREKIVNVTANLNCFLLHILCSGSWLPGISNKVSIIVSREIQLFYNLNSGVKLFPPLRRTTSWKSFKPVSSLRTKEYFLVFLKGMCLLLMARKDLHNPNITFHIAHYTIRKVQGYELFLRAVFTILIYVFYFSYETRRVQQTLPVGTPATHLANLHFTFTLFFVSCFDLGWTHGATFSQSFSFIALTM